MALIDFVEKKNRLQIRVSQLVYMFLLANCMTYIYSNYEDFSCSYKLAPFTRLLLDFKPFFCLNCYPAKKWLMPSCLYYVLLLLKKAPKTESNPRYSSQHTCWFRLVAVSFVYNQFINKTFMTLSLNSSTSLNTVSGQGLHIERKIFLTKSLLNLSYLFDIVALFCCFPFFVFCFILDLRASGYFLFILVYKIINSS